MFYEKLVPFVDLNYELRQYCMVSRYYLVLVDMFTVSWQPYNTYCLSISTSQYANTM